VKIRREPGAKLSEADLQRGVIERAQQLRWKVMHPLPGQTARGSGWATATQGDGKGFPDLTLVRERIVFVELKAQGKYLSAEQKMWRDWILDAGGEWYCWRPAQWFDGSIDTILGALPSVVFPPRDVEDDPERYRRLLKACSGDEVQATRIFGALPERETAPPR